MNWQYALALFLSAIIAAVVAFTAWRRRSAPGATGLAVSMVGLTIWAFTYAIRWLSVDQASQYFWLDATYLGVVMAPTALLVFTLQYTQRARWLSPRRLALLAVEPALTFLLLWTDPQHGLFYAGMRTTGTILNGGPWFWFHVVYSYGLLLVAVALLVIAFARASYLHRRQVGAMLLGMLLPWVSNIISLVKLNPFPDLDLTPFAFILSGLVFSYGLFHYHLLDIVPFAREQLIENMNDGLIVLDVQRRVIDINPAAQFILDISVHEIGKPADRVFAQWPELPPTYHTANGLPTELHIVQDPPRDFEVRTTPLLDRKRRLAGWLMLLHDITRRKQTEEELRNLSLTDELTGLYNRRGFLLLAEQQIKLAHRMKRGLLLLFSDMDGLKTINDTQGHAAGDLALQEVASVLREIFREADLVARLGGDEFVVLALEGPEDGTQTLINRLQKALETRNLHNEFSHPISLSSGLARYNPETPCTLAELLTRADELMYEQKKIKRNQAGD